MSRKRRDDREHFEPKKQIRTESTLSESIAHGLLSISNFKTEDIPIGETINSRYVIQNFLGKGGFAKVIIAYDKSTCRQVAIKIGTAKEQFIIKQMTKEVLALRRLNHTNIIKAYDFYIDEKLCCIVMELVEGGELFDRLTKDKRRYTEHQAQHLAKTLISTINYIHSQHVVHRDLKPDNLVMVSSSDDSDIKIIDFGLAHTDVLDESCRGRVGSAYYMAPEIVANQLYGKPVDIWSFGVILYLLLFGHVPFNGKTKDELSRAIIEGELVFPQQSPVSKEARDFVRRVLHKNPAERLTAAEALGHNWIYRSLSISTVDLSETKRNLCRFQMKRKLRKFFFVILAIVILLKKLKKVREIHQSSSFAEIIDEEETKAAATVESV